MTEVWLQYDDHFAGNFFHRHFRLKYFTDHSVCLEYSASVMLHSKFHTNIKLQYHITHIFTRITWVIKIQIIVRCFTNMTYFSKKYSVLSM